MKKRIVLILTLATLFLVSCSTTIPSSAQAQEKLEALGYKVESFTKYGDEVAAQKITQVTVLYATKGEDFLDAYFFANEEDTDTFYADRAKSLSSDVEILRKNKYSIYRGTKAAVDDFLS